eukprot:932191-Rhodomonas_salina.1
MRRSPGHSEASDRRPSEDIEEELEVEREEDGRTQSPSGSVEEEEETEEYEDSDDEDETFAQHVTSQVLYVTEDLATRLSQWKDALRSSLPVSVPHGSAKGPRFSRISQHDHPSPKAAEEEEESDSDDSSPSSQQQPPDSHATDKCWGRIQREAARMLASLAACCQAVLPILARTGCSLLSLQTLCNRCSRYQAARLVVGGAMLLLLITALVSVLVPRRWRLQQLYFRPDPLPPPPSPHSSSPSPAPPPLQCSARGDFSALWGHLACGTPSSELLSKWDTVRANLSASSRPLADEQQPLLGRNSSSSKNCSFGVPRLQAVYGQRTCAATKGLSFILTANSSPPPSSLSLLQRQVSALTSFPWFSPSLFSPSLHPALPPPLFSPSLLPLLSLVPAYPFLLSPPFLPLARPPSPTLALSLPQSSVSTSDSPSTSLLLPLPSPFSSPPREAYTCLLYTSDAADDM